MSDSVSRLLLGVTLVIAATLAACAVNPATGSRELSLVSESQEIAMGRQSDPGIVAQYGLHPDSALQRYVRDLGLRLAAVSERPDLPWTFRVLDDASINAFALPGGFIYVTRGILAHMTSEAQLAGVLGHEIGHVTARHSANQMSRAQLAQVGLVAGMIFSETVRDNAGLANAGLGLTFLKFGRDDENQADELGIRYMTREGYDPRELAGVMEMLDRSSSLGQPEGRAPEWLSTHPFPENRVENILAQVERGDLVPPAAIVRRTAFLRQIDNTVFGVDPREGYLDGGTFYHPELAFQFSPPSGWQFQNGKTAVLMGPAENDALIQFTLESEEPLAAARAFAGQQGVTSSAPQQTTINGHPSAFLDFRAQTEQGEVAGRAHWIRQDGRTYHFLGYAPAQRWNARSGAYASTVNSFATVTDSDVLNVQPARLNLVELAGAEPMSTFLERYPSSIEDQRVAIINQVRLDGVLPEGLAKRVVGGR